VKIDENTGLLLADVSYRHAPIVSPSLPNLLLTLTHRVSERAHLSQWVKNSRSCLKSEVGGWGRSYAGTKDVGRLLRSSKKSAKEERETGTEALARGSRFFAGSYKQSARVIADVAPAPFVRVASPQSLVKVRLSVFPFIGPPEKDVSIEPLVGKQQLTLV
jgi:hypothetical protein